MPSQRRFWKSTPASKWRLTKIDVIIFMRSSMLSFKLLGRRYIESIGRSKLIDTQIASTYMDCRRSDAGPFPIGHE
jgi:hypothetical protein